MGGSKTLRDPMHPLPERLDVRAVLRMAASTYTDTFPQLLLLLTDLKPLRRLRRSPAVAHGRMAHAKYETCRDDPPEHPEDRCEDGTLEFAPLLRRSGLQFRSSPVNNILTPRTVKTATGPKPTADHVYITHMQRESLIAQRFSRLFGEIQIARDRRGRGG